MKNLTMAVSLLSLTLASCGSGGDKAAQTADATANADSEMAMGGPYSEAETRMNEAMMAAVGVSVGDSWVRKMIAHHRGAIEMSNLVLAQNPSADVATMARGVVAKQTAEIAELEKLVTDGNPDAASAEPFRAAGNTMHSAMMTATGADISETYLRKMVEHHKGAVAMSEVALAQGVTGAVRTSAQKVRDEQRKEIAMTEAMLRGERMVTASVPPQAKASPSVPAAKPRPSPSSPKPRPVPPKPAPAPSSMPSDHDMDNMPGMKM